MRKRTRHYTSALPCIDLAFLRTVRRRLKDAPAGAGFSASSTAGRFYIHRQASGYTLTTGGNTRPLKLTTTQAGYGTRYWYLCPHCNRRCGKLHIGRRDVACRLCWRLHYGSQSSSEESRMRATIRRRRLALWGGTEPYRDLMNLAMPLTLFFQPEGMHWRTFEVRRTKLMFYEMRHLAKLKVILARRFPGLRL